ncbi:MAG: hypothetical protein ACYS0G_01500 [Planctomycetota bacterium]|jgi:hypothetical protein
MPPAAENAKISRPHVPARLIVRVAAAGLVAVAIVLLVSGSHETHSVSQVTREIHKIALAEPQGGLIGPWWVSAAEYDPLTDKLRSFKMECGPVHLAARTARVVVDPHKDSFKFQMWDVVLARVDESEAEGNEHDLIDLPHFVLGPIPYGIDIVSDEATTPLRPAREGSRRR